MTLNRPGRSLKSPEGESLPVPQSLAELALDRGLYEPLNQKMKDTVLELAERGVEVVHSRSLKLHPNYYYNGPVQAIRTFLDIGQPYQFRVGPFHSPDHFVPTSTQELEAHWDDFEGRLRGLGRFLESPPSDPVAAFRDFQGDPHRLNRLAQKERLLPVELQPVFTRLSRVEAQPKRPSKVLLSLPCWAMSGKKTSLLKP